MDIRKELEDLKSKIVLIEKEVKKQEKKPKEFELYLDTKVRPAWLCVVYRSEKSPHILGYIDEQGRCRFLTQSLMHENWELWKQNGFKVAEWEPVEWKGLKWQLDNVLRVSKPFPFPTHFDFIYNFVSKTTYTDVRTDDGFLQKDNEGRINLF